MIKTILSFRLAFILVILSALLAAAQTVSESARQIPLAYDVDVVVIGGTTRGVAAAKAAAEKGATVFLAAPRPYLGVDMCGNYRLWLNEGEIPKSALAKAVFLTKNQTVKLRKSLAFTYKANVPTNKAHKDSSKKPLLSDEKASSPDKESVQYDTNVSIITDLKKKQKV